MMMGVLHVSFDPKDKQTVNKTIRLDETLVKKVYEEAGKRQLSFNKFISQCIEYAMENLKHEDDDEVIDLRP
jgi:predicted HicB family RNase H-like nuclease